MNSGVTIDIANLFEVHESERFDLHTRRLNEQMVKVLCFDLLSRERINEHLQRIREHHAAKLFYYEDSLRRHGENKPKQVRLGPLLTLHRGILAARAYVQWCDEALLLVASAEHRH